MYATDDAADCDRDRRRHHQTNKHEEEEDEEEAPRPPRPSSRSAAAAASSSSAAADTHAVRQTKHDHLPTTFPLPPLLSLPPSRQLLTAPLSIHPSVHPRSLAHTRTRRSGGYGREGVKATLRPSPTSVEMERENCYSSQIEIGQTTRDGMGWGKGQRDGHMRGDNNATVCSVWPRRSSAEDG